MNRYHGPRRRVLYGLYSLMVVLLVAPAALPVSVAWHQLMEAGVVGATLALHLLWWRRNAAVLEDERMLQDISTPAAMRRPLPLTQVEVRYLSPQARRHEEPDTSLISSVPSHPSHPR